LIAFPCCRYQKGKVDRIEVAENRKKKEKGKGKRTRLPHKDSAL
jgi:hypothetical protein